MSIRWWLEDRLEELRSLCATLVHSTRRAKDKLVRVASDSELHKAVRAGDIAKVSTLLAVNTDPNAPNALGEVPLAVAAASGNAELVRLLLAHKADPASRGTYTAVRKACYQSDDILAMFLEQGISPHQMLPDGDTLMEFVCREAPSALPLLVKHGADLCRLGRERRSLLHIAAQAGNYPTHGELHVDAVKMLSKAGVPQSSNLDGYTPLHLAMLNHRWHIARTLLEHGADPNALTSDGMSALALAINHAGELEEYRVISALKSANAELNVADAYGRTLLHTLAEHKNLMATDRSKAQLEIVTAAIPIDTPDNDGKTPLHCAADYIRVETVRYLLDKGANPSALTSSGKSPLALAYERLSETYTSSYREGADTVALLIARGARMTIDCLRIGSMSIPLTRLGGQVVQVTANETGHVRMMVAHEDRSISPLDLKDCPALAIPGNSVTMIVLTVPGDADPSPTLFVNHSTGHWQAIPTFEQRVQDQGGAALISKRSGREVSAKAWQAQLSTLHEILVQTLLTEKHPPLAWLPQPAVPHPGAQLASEVHVQPADVGLLAAMEGARLSNTTLPGGTRIPAAPDGLTWVVVGGHVVLRPVN